MKKIAKMVKSVLTAVFFFLGPYIVLLLVSFFTSSPTSEIVLELLIGGIIALHVLVILFIITAPLTAGLFTSTVKNQKHIPFTPLFTAVENGRAKTIVDQGGNVVRYVMNLNDHSFNQKRELDGFDPSNDNWWQVVRNETHKNARNVWEKWIEKKTGLVFVGIYPWRMKYYYELSPIKVLTQDGTRAIVIPTESTISDHVRVREFNWGAKVHILFKDMYSVDIDFSFRLITTNPHKLLFGVDSWGESFADAVGFRTITLLQGKTIDELTELDEQEKSLVAEKVKMISNEVEPKTEKSWGLKIIEAQISKYDFKPLSDKEKEALTIKAVTKRNMEAREIEYETEAKGESNVVRRRASAIKAHGEPGKQASRDQMLETAAKDGQQTMITGLGDSSSENSEQIRLLKAILAAQTQNKENKIKEKKE